MYKLNDKYSDREHELFALLPQSQKAGISTLDLMETFYSGLEVRTPRQAMVSALHYLEKRLVDNKEPFRIAKSKRNGPHPISFWVERRK